MATTSAPCPDKYPGLDHLPSALLATIMMKLDVPSIQSLGSTCKTFRTCASHVLSFLPNFHLLDIAPSMDLLIPLLPPNNPYLRSLKVDCTRLDDSSLEFLIRPSLQELCLRNCADFSGKLLSELGRHCKDIRFLYLSSVAEKRGRSIDVSHLEELLSGCSQLEVKVHFTSKLDKYLHSVWRVFVHNEDMGTTTCWKLHLLYEY